MIEALSSLDKALFLILNSWHLKFLDPIMTILSGQTIWMPFIALMLFLAFKQFNRKIFFLYIVFLLIAIVASDVTSSYIIKNIVQRLRPCRVSELKPLIYNIGQKCGGRFGFVSSHAANAFCILSFSFMALKFKSYKLHFLWILPITVSFSRIYLGVHYPGDILGGMIIGLTWGYLMGAVFKNQELWGKTA